MSDTPTPPTADTVAIDLSDWLTLGDAAARIGCSTRTVERLARAKKLEGCRRRQTNGHDVVVYDPSDIDRVASARQPTPSAPFVVPHPAAGNGAGRANLAAALPVPALAAVVSELVSALKLVAAPGPTPPTLPGVSEKLCVTIREASVIAGLSQAYLRQRIEDKQLPVIRDGRRVRIRRRDLEQL